MPEKEQTTLSQLVNIIDCITSGSAVSHNEGVRIESSGNPDIDQLAEKIATLQKQYNDCYPFIMSLAKGKLDSTPPAGNSFATPYKQLQAELRYLTWQIQQIADGDYNQQVSFSGDFSTSINKMIIALRERKVLSDLLEESNHTKDKLFSIIAHDLKSPFNVLVGMSEVLLQEIESGNQDTSRELSLVIRDAAVNGYALLTNLLEWSRLQIGRITPTPSPFDLRSIILGNIQLAKVPAQTKGIDLYYTDDIQEHPIISDSTLLNTILRNLISNAIKYTYHGGKIEVSTQPTGQGYRIIVKDSGVGMKEEDVKNLFRIETIKSTNGTSNEQGTGLGLILCRDFASKIGGEIKVESVYGVGSTFTVTIPNMECPA